MSRLSFSLRLPVRVSTASQALTNEMSVLILLTNQRPVLPNADQRRGESQQHGLVDIELVLQRVDLGMKMS